jgi:hypothetical protein
VASAIGSGDDRIFGLQQHLIVFIDQDGAEGMVAMVTGSLRDLDRCSKMLEICVLHMKILSVVYLGRPCSADRKHLIESTDLKDASKCMIAVDKNQGSSHFIGTLLQHK